MSAKQLVTPEILSHLKKLTTKKLVEFCAKDIRPFEIVVGEGFRILAQHFISVGANHGHVDISKILPHPTTISRNVTAVKKTIHGNVFPKIQNAIKNDLCSATTDMWTDDYKKNAFLTMTVHYFDDNFTLNRAVLFTSSFPKRQAKNGVNIKAEIIRRFKSFGLEEEDLKNLPFVTDRGSNVIKALECYIRKNCCAHLLNIVLKNTFNNDDVPLIFMKIICNCKNIVRYLKQSGKANELSAGVNQEGETRWNSKLDMINSVVKKYDEIMLLLPTKNRTKWQFNPALAKEIVTFLTPFKDATKSLEGDTYSTANKILLWYYELLDHLNKENYIGPMKKMVEVAKRIFQSKFKITMDNKIDCFLDPRYRFLKMLSADERSSVYNKINDMLHNMPIPQLESVALELPLKKGRFSALEGDDVSNVNEFELYMESADFSCYLANDNDKKHLVELFWRDNCKRYPKLSHLAKSRLHVPATSAPSERMFSCAGRTYDIRRTNLKPQILDDLLFIKLNFEVNFLTINKITNLSNFS